MPGTCSQLIKQIAAISALAFCSMHSNAQWINQDLKVLAADGEENDQLGSSIAVSSGRLVIGSRLDNSTASGAGSVYVFDTATGTQLMKLIPDPGSNGAFFGNSIAISDALGVVAIGAPEDSLKINDAGAV